MFELKRLSHALWKNATYNASADPSEAIVVVETKQAWQWWKPTLIAADALIYGGIAIGVFSIVKILVLDEIFKPKKKETEEEAE